MPGLVAIIAEPYWPDLTDALEQMLAALAQPDGRVARLVLPEWGVALGHAGPARFATRQMVDHTSVGAGALRPYFPAVPLALLDGEPLDLPAVAGRLGLPAEVAPAGVVAALYARDGAEALAALDGHWAAAIIDPARRAVIFANDAFGIRPLYRSRATDGAWLVASHPAALLAYPTAVRRLDPAGLAEQLAIGVTLNRRTLYEGIELLPPATLATFAAGQWATRRYWRPLPAPVERHTERDMEKVRQLFNASVYRAAAAGGPFSLALTGGMDARAILSALVVGGIRPHTVIHSVPGSTDAMLAAELARRAGATHHFLEVRGEDLPDLVRPAVQLLGGVVLRLDVHPLRFLDELTSFTQVMFTGLGADLTRRDYGGIHLRPAQADRATVAQALFKYFNFQLSVETDFPVLLDEAWYAALRDQPARAIQEALDVVDPAVPRDEVGGVVELQEFLPRFWVKGDLIVRRELETRHPFMDRAFLMAAWNLPRDVRDAAGVQRYVITRNAPTLADVPYEHDGLPLRYPFARHERWQGAWRRAEQQVRVLLGRPYVRVPNYRYAEWIRGPLRPLFAAVLLDPRSLARPYFRGETIRRWFDEHLAGKDNTTRLTMLMTLELTVRMLIERDVN
ncbi:MAG: asparagine synthase-related protein [Chloroflexi bacterium]|nr:asparagine synthase-related protein [Chloroflexota bacterium]